MKFTIKTVLLCFGLLFAPTSCAAVLKALPTIIQYVQDAQIVLDMIDRQAAPILKLADEQVQKDYARAMGVAQTSLQVALRSTKGTEELSKEQVDASFENFREAYKDLLSVLQSAGLMSADGMMKAAPGMEQVTVPEPLAIAR